MRKWKKIILAVLPFALMVSFQSFAGQWKQDMNGWWYENDDGTWITGGWHWVDGNGDGTAECYYFDKDGYVVKDLGYVDGWQVDENGAWIVDGKVQTKQVEVKENAPQTPEASDTQEAPPEDLMDGRALYLMAVSKNNSLDQVDTDVELEMTESSDGVSITMSARNNLKARGLTSENLEYVSTGNISMLGITVPIDEFYTGGYYYSSGYKESMSPEEALDQTLAGTAHVLSADDLEEMESITVKRDGENKVLTMTMKNPEDFFGGGSQADVKTAEMEIVIDRNGYCIGQVIRLDMDETSYGGTSNLKMNARMTLHNPGQPVGFEIPSTGGYEEYYYLQ